MAYSTLEDLRRLIEERHLVALSNDNATGTVVNDANIATAIEQADRLIDGYAGLQRTVPLTPVPGLIKMLSASLAVFLLYRRRGQVPEIWEKQYQADMTVLHKIGAGTLTFGSPETGREPPPERALTSSSAKTLGGSGGLLGGF